MLQKEREKEELHSILYCVQCPTRRDAFRQHTKIWCGDRVYAKPFLFIFSLHSGYDIKRVWVCEQYSREQLPTYYTVASSSLACTPFVFSFIVASFPAGEQEKSNSARAGERFYCDETVPQC